MPASPKILAPDSSQKPPVYIRLRCYFDAAARMTVFESTRFQGKIPVRQLRCFYCRQPLAEQAWQRAVRQLIKRSCRAVFEAEGMIVFLCE